MGTRLIAANKSDPEKIHQFNKLYGYATLQEIQSFGSARYLVKLGKSSFESLEYAQYMAPIELSKEDFKLFMQFYEKDIQDYYSETDFTLEEYYADEMNALLNDDGNKIIYWC